MDTERLKGWLSSSSKLVAASAQLAKKQAELTTLNNVTLPRLYHAIGKRIIGSTNLPPDLQPHRDKIRELEAAIATKPEEPKPEPASGFAAKAKHLAQQAASKTAKATADAAASMKIQSAYVALGRQAIEKYGLKALPQELREQYEAAMQKQAALAGEIGGLKSAPGKGFVTPERLALFGVAACVLLGLWTLRGAVGWLFSRPAYVAVAAATPRQEALDPSPSVSNQPTADDTDDDDETTSSSPHIGARDPVIAELLGPTSQHYTTFGYKDVLLGQTFAEIDSKRPLRWVRYDAPYIYGDGPNSPHGFIFDENDRLVCYQVKYQGGPGDYLAELTDLFGPPESRIAHRSERLANSATDLSTIRYIFPQTIVCVDFANTTNLFTTTEETLVRVLDRRYVEELLAVSASARRKAINWIVAAAACVKARSVTVDNAPSLDGCRTEDAGIGTHKGIALVDQRYEQDPNKPDYGMRTKKGRVAEAGLSIDADPDNHDGVSFDFRYFTPAYTDRLLKRTAIEGQADIPPEAIKCLPYFWRLEAEMTTLMLQEHFAPRGGKYQYMQRPRAGVMQDSGVYEWDHDESDGSRWSIECAEEGYVNLHYKPRKRL